MQHQVELAEARRLLVGIAGLADLDRVAQQRTRLRARDALQAHLLTGGLEQPVDGRARDLQQLRTRVTGQPVRVLAELVELLKLGQPQAHRGRQILARVLAGESPDPDQQVERVVAVRARARRPPHSPLRALASGCSRQLPTRVRARPARRRHERVEHPPTVLLRRASVLTRMLLRDLTLGCHRQLRAHPASTPQRPTMTSVSRANPK